MSYEFESELEYETEPARDVGPLQSSRRTAILIYISLALIGTSVAFLWREYGRALDDFTIVKTEAASRAVSSKVFDEYQQSVAGNLRRYSGMLEAQDAAIKRLSDQLLHLTMRMDSFESRARDAQAAISPAKAASKKPAARSRTFTGGAPLPPVPEENQ